MFRFQTNPSTSYYWDTLNIYIQIRIYKKKDYNFKKITLIAYVVF